MSDYTPTTDEVREGYGYYLNPTRLAEFDRWLAGELAKAWDRGYSSGHREAHTNVTERNPYRQERKER